MWNWWTMMMLCYKYPCLPHIDPGNNTKEEKDPNTLALERVHIHQV